MEQIINQVTSLSGVIEVPGDKSISHRAIMLGAISEGTTYIEGFLNANDCLSTIHVFRQLGVEIEKKAINSYLVRGRGLRGLREPIDVLDVGNSGTTIRLTSGILAGQNFHSVLKGDHSILSRPMGRVVEPLQLMGATISGRESGKYAPLAIKGGSLKGIHYQSPIASAQVKSAILLAGLYAENETVVVEPTLSRDHTEKMLIAFGADIVQNGTITKIMPANKLQGERVMIPGDFSSAAFFIAAALLVPNSELRINNVGLNPTRIGFLDAIKAMNGNVEIVNIKSSGSEPVGDLIIRTSSLYGIEISGEWIPRIIDEIPILAVVASQANGITKVTDAKELRVKETDRIKTTASELRKLGVMMEELDDGFIIMGKQTIQGGNINSHGDHRIGMAMGIAGLIAKDKVRIDGIEAIHVSYPAFFSDLINISKY